MRRILLLCLIAAPMVPAQTYQVPLKVRLAERPGMGYGTDIISDDATHAHSAIPGGGELRIERVGAPANSLLIQIPSGDPSSVALLPQQRTEVTLPRAVGEAQSASYTVSYMRHEDDGKTYEAIGWQPNYRAEGRLKLPGCEVNVMVFDFNADGRFDRTDSRQASTLGLDLNLDGHVDEWHKMEEILDVCGTPLEVAALDPAGNSITFRTSELTTPAIGEIVPAFSVPTTVPGRMLNSGAMRGTVHLLDFWASWCAPCVAGLDDVAALARQYSGSLKVYGIDVDEPERRATADRIIQEKAPLYPQVIREQGEKDFLWKMFGSMTGVKLAIPLFVVVDQEGRIQYASHGGEQLSELKQVLSRILPAAN